MRTPQTEQMQSGKASSPYAGLLFLLAGLGSFYGLISVIDPLL